MKTFFELIKSKPPTVLKLSSGDEAVGVFRNRAVFDAEFVPLVRGDFDQGFKLIEGWFDDERGHDRAARDCCVLRRTT